ncbi:amidohydrolase family protein, partial [Escherichia coli]
EKRVFLVILFTSFSGSLVSRIPGAVHPGFQFLLEHAETQQIWLKLSGAYRNGSTETLNDNVAPLIPLLLQHFGPAHLLWGSDWPHTRYENVVNYQKTFELLTQQIPDKEMRNKILSVSAESLID